MGGWGECNRLDVEGRVFRFQLPNCFFPLTEVTDQGLVVMKASKQIRPWTRGTGSRILEWFNMRMIQ